MMEKILLVANKRIWSETRKEKRRLLCSFFSERVFFFLWRSLRSFIICRVCVSFSLTRLDFPLLLQHTHDRQLNSRRSKHLSLPRTTKAKTRDLSFDTITNLVYCRSIKREEKEREKTESILGKLFFIFSIDVLRDMQLWTTTCMTLSLTIEIRRRERDKARMTLACFPAFSDKNVTHFH